MVNEIELWSIIQGINNKLGIKMISKRVVIYLPSNFYSAIASSIAEIFQAVNELAGSDIFEIIFIAEKKATSRSGIVFPVNKKIPKRIDILILLSGLTPEIQLAAEIIEKESKFVSSFIYSAKKQGAIIAGTCGASLVMAHLGLLNGKRATVAWWMKDEALLLYPEVKWEIARMVVQENGIYTSGAVYAGIDLVSVLLIDLGFIKEEKLVRQIMAIPVVREYQTPYETVIARLDLSPFEQQLNKIINETGLTKLTIANICSNLAMTYRSVFRKFKKELSTSPGIWIQDQRLGAAKLLLQETQLSIGEICYQVGYLDQPSFSRLFLKKTGLNPTEFRRQAH